MLAASSRCRSQWLVALLATACGLALAPPGPASAADVIKANNTTALNDAGSWVSGGPPGTADVGVWDSTVTGANSVNLGGALSWQGIRIANPGGLVTINHSAATTLTLGSSGIDMSGATQNLTFGGNAGLVIGANQTWNIASGRTLEIGVDRNGELAAHKVALAGSGTLRLIGGTLSLATGTASSLGSFEAYSGTVNIAHDLAVTGKFSVGETAASTFNHTAGIVNANSATGGFGSGLNIGHRISGNGTYNLTGGTLNTTAAATLGAGGGTTGIFNISGGTANLTGLTMKTSDSASATVNLTGGRLNLAAGGITSVVTDATNRNLNFGGGTLGATANWSSSLAINLTGTNGNLTINTLDAGDDVTARTITLGGQLSGTGGFAKTGTGTLSLSATNTYSGATTISVGTLRVGNNGTTGTLGTGNVVNNAALLFSRSDNITVANVISGTGTLTKAAAGTVSLTGASTYTGATTISVGTLALGNGGTTGGLARESAIEIAAGATLHWNRSNSDTGISNAISGAGTILKSGGGEIAFTGTNTFSGTIDIQAGKLAFSGANSASGAPNVTVATGAIVSLGEGFSNSTATIGSLSGSGRVDPQFGSTTGTRTLSVTGGTFAGRLTDADSGSIRLLALTKAGLGTLTLSGINTYTGGTTVDAGTLLVNGSLAAGSAVTVQSSATLGGSGSIGGPTSILAGGILSPGTSPGTLTITNTLSLADTSILNFEIDAADPSSSVFNDLITGVTDLTLGGTLDLTGSGDFSTVPAGTLWRLINYSGTLTDNTLAIGTAPTLAAGLSFSVDTATAGQVNLVVVPEPGALALAALGLAAGIGWLRRRQA